jgi:hypothetical protein
MRAFIIRPFGVRRGINFEDIEERLVGRALDSIGAEGRTTGEILESGNIRIEMFQRLLVADLVVADITTNNPNVFYELGIRHGLQEKRTFLIRAKLPLPAAVDELKEIEVPFDLKTDRYLEYDPVNPEEALPRLTEALRLTAASPRQDSPVFLSLPNLQPQNRERFIPVPLGFGEEVQRAEKDRDGRKLTLLGLEARGFPWESTGLRVVGRALVLIKRYAAAKTAWESLRALDEFDLEANLNLGNIFQRLGDLTGSDQALERALQRATEPKHLAEIHGQLGRNRKDRWARSWSNATTEDRARTALDSLLLPEAYEQYLLAYRQDLNSYYPGLNALALAVVIVELAARLPDVWTSLLGDERTAKDKLDDITMKREQLAQSLHLRFAGVDAPQLSSDDRQDPWLLSSAGDLSLFTQPSAKRAVYFYRKAAASQGEFVLDSVRRQIQMFADLGILQSNIADALKLLPEPREPEKHDLERVVLFTGHRVDSATRKTPRFPASKEGIARNAISEVIHEQRELTNGRLLGIAGGANGGDILFLELCKEAGIPTQMLLALPEDRFITASVGSEDTNWVRRFHTLVSSHDEVPVLCESEQLPSWLQFKKNYDVWQRNNLWLLSEALCRGAKHLTLIALWDGETGDGPGGTEHMVRLARERGARIIHLDTKDLFGLR